MTYNQYMGESTGNRRIADGWRKDTINGGINKEIYHNRYLSSQADQLGFDRAGHCAPVPKSYLFKNGRWFTGKIADTLTLSYSQPFQTGTCCAIETGYERQDIIVIFHAECLDGLVEGPGTLSDLNAEQIISHCSCERGEIVGGRGKTELLLMP